MTGYVAPKKGKLYTVIKLPTGKKKWEKTGLADNKGNRKEAEKILRARLDDYKKYEDGQVDYTEISFVDYLKEYMVDIAINQVKSNTYHEYELIVFNKIVPYFTPKKIKLRDLKPMDIQKFYTYRLNVDKVTAKTVKRGHCIIHKALDYALMQNLIMFNPADRVALPKEEEFVGSFYTEEEIRGIFDAIQGHLLETPILLAATFGFRLSEVLGLKWDAIDFENNRITVKHTVVGSGKHQVRADTTKSKSSNRSLALIAPIAQHLWRVKAAQERNRKKYGDKYVESDYICTRSNGKLLLPGYVSKNFGPLMAASDFPVYRFHDLRHSSASLLLANGCSLKEIAAWLGHSNIATTNRYAHLQFKQTQQMANTVQNKLFVTDAAG